MIYTLTLNPAIDYLMWPDEIEPGKTNRSQKESTLPGGKGINVSRVLNQLQVENTALGFLGGFAGDFIKDWLNAEGSKSDFVSIENTTRINVKIKGSKETEINAKGPQVTDQELGQLVEKIDGLQAGDTLVITGNAGPGVAPDFYTQLAKRCDQSEVNFVLDIATKEIFDILPYKPLLVKPNRDELEALFETAIESMNDTITYGQKLQDLGAQYVIISLGGDGALLITEDALYKANAPAEKVINTVGAGDSMVAGFIAKISQEKPAKDALQLATACSAATTSSEDLAQKEAIEGFMDKVEITKL